MFEARVAASILTSDAFGLCGDGARDTTFSDGISSWLEVLRRVLQQRWCLYRTFSVRTRGIDVQVDRTRIVPEEVPEPKMWGDADRVEAGTSTTYVHGDWKIETS